jgi:hypothetical protein
MKLPGSRVIWTMCLLVTFGVESQAWLMWVDHFGISTFAKLQTPQHEALIAAEGKLSG